MSRPPLNPKKTAAGIALDPQSLDRVVPESRRADGSVRKQLKIRPGFTPQEDVQRFRGSKQAQMDANALPKGHIIGWVPPTAAESSSKPMSKGAKKNAKRKEKRDKEREEAAAKQPVTDNWEDDDELDESSVKKSAGTPSPGAPADKSSDVDAIAEGIDKLAVSSEPAS